jgi:ATP-dependent Lon protease
MANKVFDFSAAADEEKENGKGSRTAVTQEEIRTYVTFRSDAEAADAEHPFLVLRNEKDQLRHHTSGNFEIPEKRTSFHFMVNGTPEETDITEIDERFEDLIRWIGDNRINVRLSGKVTERGYCVYKIREVDSGGETKLSAEDGFLQYAIARLLAAKAPADAPDEDNEEIEGDDMKLTSLQSITDFLNVAGRSLPPHILKWARRNLVVARSTEIGPDERRHAQRALSIMLNIQWKDTTFGSIDPVEARRILDEELYGMESVKQRIIETIIQINRTHTLPAYGLLLVGPAGTGKSQVAYAVARILKLPWTTLDMSAIHDSEQLTGTSRVYANAKPGSIMEAFYVAGESNLVFIINELDKADSKTTSGNPADALLTLLDNLGYTDNYMECTIPTGGVYPIATANDKSRISEPLMTRFAVIDIPDYTRDEKKTIFSRYSLPKVLKRMGMTREECVVTEEGAYAVVDRFAGMPGVRDLEQAAEHLAAHALYRIETEGVAGVTYEAKEVNEVLMS